MATNFENLEAWKACRNLRLKISDFVKSLPNEEKYRMSNQLIRASRSTTANIAEGHGRFYYQENIQFCRHAKGSLSEILDHLICAFDEKYISAEKLTEFRQDIEMCIRILN